MADWSVNTSKNVVYERTSDNTKHNLKKVIYNGVTVWSAETTITVNKSATISQNWADGEYASTPVYSSAIATIDCTNYSYADVIVKYTKDSDITNTTTGALRQDGYIDIGTSRSSALYTWKSDRTNGTETLEGGTAVNTWKTLTININSLTGLQSVKAYGSNSAMSATFTISTIRLYN